MVLDREIEAMSGVLELFKTLDQAQRIRVVNWVTARFNLVDAQIPVKTQPEPAPQAAPEPAAQAETPAPVEAPAPEAEAPAPAPAPAPAEIPAPVEAPAPAPVEVQPVPEPVVPKPKEIKKYKSIVDLFNASSVNTIMSQILLGAAYLHEHDKVKEFTSQNVNTLLKKIGKPVKNVSLTITRMLDKTPALIEVTSKIGATKQARRTFRLTETGLKRAKSYMGY